MKHIGTHGTCHQQRSRRTQASADGDMGIDMDLDTSDFLAHGGHDRAVGYIGQIIRAGKCLIAAGDFQAIFRFFKGYIGVQAQGTAKSVKSRAQVCGSCRDTNGYSFHNFFLFHRFRT